MDALTEATLRLVFTPGLGPRRIKLLIEAFGDAEQVFEAAPAEWRRVEGIGPKIIEAMTAARTSDAPAKELERAERLKIRLLPLTHPDYPESLRQIFDPPSILYVRGTLPKAVLREPSQVRALGVVGTREASDYALELSRAISRELAGAGVVIVSGLALGVDTTAHEGAVGVAGGETIAVLGSGVNVIYPRQNVRLAEKILEGHGAIVSEYRIGTEPQAKNFPGRNRIINGLSRGILVVEGGASSGAMITAEYALEEGRTVFAVPGRAGDARAVGTLGLLKQGAVLTTGVEDILNEFGWQAGASATAPAARSFSEAERGLLNSMTQRGSPLLDDLMADTGKRADEILPLLMLLELQGVVKTLPGGRYVSLLRD